MGSEKLTDSMIVAAAASYQLPVEIVRAMCGQESSNNDDAMRYEKDFDRRYNLKPGDYVPANCSRDTEEVGRATSWGPMQVMGETARCLGFKGWFPELCEPDVGLEWGCRYLRRLADRYLADGGWPVVLRAYNGGPGNRHNLSNKYPEHVLARIPGGVWPD